MKKWQWEPLKLETAYGIGSGDCEWLYKQYSNSVQHLLVMAFGLKSAEGQDIADFEEDEMYKAYLMKSLVPKVPLVGTTLKTHITRSLH
jgi:hypothetical protein